ncbi:MAG TPA: hypothetical protein VK801_08200 [Caulobacteraceae bacterium]|jgi:hypothetical protein|nr:hypothetical protein [Caulobacteraceae bacterium]
MAATGGMIAPAGDLLVRFVLAALATWRVSHLLAAEDGPGDVIFHLRRKLGTGWLGSLADCFNCLSLFVAAPVALFVSRQPIVWVVAWLALSGGACLLERLGQSPPLTDPFVQPETGEADVLRFETRDVPSAPDADPRAARGGR